MWLPSYLKETQLRRDTLDPYFSSRHELMNSTAR